MAQREMALAFWGPLGRESIVGGGSTMGKCPGPSGNLAPEAFALVASAGIQ